MRRTTAHCLAVLLAFHAVRCDLSTANTSVACWSSAGVLLVQLHLRQTELQAHRNRNDPQCLEKVWARASPRRRRKGSGCIRAGGPHHRKIRQVRALLFLALGTRENGSRLDQISAARRAAPPVTASASPYVLPIHSGHSATAGPRILFVASALLPSTATPRPQPLTRCAYPSGSLHP